MKKKKHKDERVVGHSFVITSPESIIVWQLNKLENKQTLNFWLNMATLIIVVFILLLNTVLS